MDELRAWVRAAEGARATCLNLSEFEVLILQQRRRLEAFERVAFGPDELSEGIYLGALSPYPGQVHKKRRTAEEAEIDRQLKKQREADDLDAFLPCYERATGLTLNIEEEAEDPDFIAARSDGQSVGIELTMITEGSVGSIYREVLTGNAEWDPDDALDQMAFLIRQKATKIPRYRTKFNILVLQSIETNFTILSSEALHIPPEDFTESGFDEIWLADYRGLRNGMHREIQMLGLHPKNIRSLTRRPDYDNKPYG